MEKPKSITLELKTHAIEVGFRIGGIRRTFYREDKIGLKGDVYDGFKDFLAHVSGPGFIEIRENLFRPHAEIGSVELKESTVTRVVELENQGGGWIVVSEE